MEELSEERKGEIALRVFESGVEIHQSYFKRKNPGIIERSMSRQLKKEGILEEEFTFKYYGLLEDIEKLSPERKRKIALIIMRRACKVRQLYLKKINLKKFVRDMALRLKKEGIDKQEILFIYDELLGK